jgi:hypothetical protein
MSPGRSLRPLIVAIGRVEPTTGANRKAIRKHERDRLGIGSLGPILGIIPQTTLPTFELIARPGTFERSGSDKGR